MPCPFCEIIEERAPAKFIARWPGDAIAIEPLNPVTEGHVLVIPNKHVEHAGVSPQTTAMTMYRAAELAAGRPANIITSIGPEATQSVFHLHIHVVPRREGDGLA